MTLSQESVILKIYFSKNYFLFTNSLNFLPAEKAGTVLAAILISLPVCGFLPVLAALFLDSNVPKPTKVTFSPLATVFCTVSTKPFKQTPHNDAEEFFSILHKAGINVTLRMEHGSDIDAACGQLRAKRMREDKNE